MNLFDSLMQQLDGPQGRFSLLDRYYAGDQAVTFLNAEEAQELNRKLFRMSVNIPRLAVDSLAERLRVTGLRVDGAADAQLWSDWKANNLDEMAAVAHREALTLGECPVIVWADDQGNPRVSVESPTQCVVRRDPATREVTAALKRWSNEDAGQTYAVEYLPDQIVWFVAQSAGATGGFQAVRKVDNPLGVVPVVDLRNSDRLLGPGASEVDDLIPLVDALDKLTLDMLTASEQGARPRRWATGIVMDEDFDEGGDSTPRSPFDESNRMLITDTAESKFGQLPGADLSAYRDAVDVIVQQIMAVSALPAHMVGVTAANPTSADALRAAESGLTARAEARQVTFGRAWEQVAATMVAVRTGADPRAIRTSVDWAPADTRSAAQEADATVKLFQAGILPRRYALQKLGYSAEDIAQIEATTASTN